MFRLSLRKRRLFIYMIIRYGQTFLDFARPLNKTSLGLFDVDRVPQEN